MPNYGSMAGIRGYKSIYIYDKRLPYTKDDLVAWVDNTKRAVTVRKALVDIKPKASFKNANWTEVTFNCGENAGGSGGQQPQQPTFSGLDKFSETRAYKTGDIAYWVEGDILSVRRANTEVSPGTYNPTQWNEFMFKPDASASLGGSETFSPTKNYKKGDLAFFTEGGNIIFRVAKENITAGAYNPAQWEEVTFRVDGYTLGGVVKLHTPGKPIKNGEFLVREGDNGVLEVYRTLKDHSAAESSDFGSMRKLKIGTPDAVTNAITPFRAGSFKRGEVVYNVNGSKGIDFYTAKDDITVTNTSIIEPSKWAKLDLIPPESTDPTTLVYNNTKSYKPGDLITELDEETGTLNFVTPTKNITPSSKAAATDFKPVKVSGSVGYDPRSNYRMGDIIGYNDGKTMSFYIATKNIAAKKSGGFDTSDGWQAVQLSSVFSNPSAKVVSVPGNPFEPGDILVREVNGKVVLAKALQKSENGTLNNTNYKDIPFYKAMMSADDTTHKYEKDDIIYKVVGGELKFFRSLKDNNAVGILAPSDWAQIDFGGGKGAEFGYSQAKSYKMGDMLFETNSANRLVFYSAKKDIPKNTPFNLDDWLKYDLDGAGETNNLNGMVYDTSKSYQKGDIVLYEKLPNVFEILRAKKNIGIGEAFNHNDWESGTIDGAGSGSGGGNDNLHMANMSTGGDATAFYMNHAFIEYGCNVFGSPSDRKIGLNHDGTPGVNNSALRFGDEVITIPNHAISYPIPTNPTNKAKVWYVQAGKKYTGALTLLNNGSNEYLKVTEKQDTSMCLLCTVTVPPNDYRNDLTRCTVTRGPARASTATPNIVIPTNNKLRIPYRSTDLKYLVQFFDEFGSPVHYVRIISRDKDGFDVEGTECVYGKKITWCVLRPDKYVAGGWFSLVASNTPSVVISGFSPEQSKAIREMIIADSVLNTSANFTLLERQAMYPVPKFISISRLRKITQSMFGRDPGVNSETIGGVELKRIDNGHYAVVETGAGGKKIIHLGYFTIRNEYDMAIDNGDMVLMTVAANSITVARRAKTADDDNFTSMYTWFDSEALRTMTTFGLAIDGTASGTSDQWFKTALYPDFEGHEEYTCSYYQSSFKKNLGYIRFGCGGDVKANDECLAGIGNSIFEHIPETAGQTTTVQMNSGKSGIIVPHFKKFLEENNWNAGTTALHLYKDGVSVGVIDTETDHIGILASDNEKYTKNIGLVLELCIEASTLPYNG